jgi:hypothetical protein
MYTVFLLIVAIIFAVYFIPVKIRFLLDTDDMDMRVSATWLSFVKADARVFQRKVFIRVYLFGLKIVSRFLGGEVNDRPTRSLIQAMALHDVTVKVRYGLNEPGLTGIFNAALGFVGTLIRGADVRLYPDYMPDNEFMRIEAAANLYAGRTVENWIATRLKTNQKEKRLWTSSA